MLLCAEPQTWTLLEAKRSTQGLEGSEAGEPLFQRCLCNHEFATMSELNYAFLEKQGRTRSLEKRSHAALA